MAVSISGASGTWTHGNTVTISGSGFGTKTTAAPNLFDRVDNISAYAAVTDGQTIPTGGGYPWVNNSAFSPGAIKMERTASEQRGVSTACYKGPSAGYDQTLRDRTVTGATKL
jgi:hypothetical protein